MFDALYALTHVAEAKKYLPRPRVRPLDNISKCRVLLPEFDPNYFHIKLDDRQKAAAANARAKQLKENRIKADELAKRAPTSLRGLPDRLATHFTKGPMNLLRLCYMEKRKVCVQVRYNHNTQGTLVGYIKAFDKHMNLVMSDCIENKSVLAGIEWSPRAEDVAIAQSRSSGMLSSKASRRFKQRKLYENRERHLHQTMLRGDNVILVHVLRE